MPGQLLFLMFVNDVPERVQHSVETTRMLFVGVYSFSATSAAAVLGRRRSFLDAAVARVRPALQRRRRHAVRRR